MDFWSRVELELLFMFFLTMVALVLSVHIDKGIYGNIPDPYLARNDLCRVSMGLY